MTYQGKIWGTAQDFNGQMIFVNLDLLAQRNLPAPGDTWTMDQYRDLAKQLTDPDKKVLGSSNFINQAGWANFAFLWNYGKHYWLSADGRRSVVASAASVQAHQFFADMQFRDRSIPWRDNPLPSGASAATGQLAFSLVWGNYPFSLYDTWAKSGQQPFSWKMLPFPKGPQDQKNFSHGHLWSIPKSNRRPDATWVLAEWIGGLEGWREWAKTHHQPLPVKSADLWKTYFDFLPAEKAAEMTTFLVDRLYAGLAFNLEYWPTYGDCSKVMAGALTAIYTDNADVKSTLEDAQRKMDAVLVRS
jgi:ABC-type glycerol-3-phosphate transport system substrate-binding protein